MHTNVLKSLKRILSISVLLLLLSSVALAQSNIEKPDPRYLFSRDAPDLEKLRKKRFQTVTKTDAPARPDLDFKAPQVEFEKDKNVAKGSGGVLISQGGLQAQADKATVNLDTKDSNLEGNVLISGGDGSLAADKSSFNFDSETGKFENADIGVEDGGYRILADEALKKSETQYSLFDSAFTTCACPDKSRPWNIHSSEANITQESYAHCYNSWVDFHGVPLFYTPYIAFPVKQERQSGLLVPEFGYSSRDGFQYQQPLFIVLDDSTDMTLTPFTETRTRNGTFLEGRKAFSRYNNAEGRFLYSNERPRDGDLRGTGTDGVFDAVDDPDNLIDEDRVGGYYSHIWQSSPQAEIPISFISDVHLASDDLLVREIEDEDIGETTSQYLTSVALLRSELTDDISAELGAEYNQFIVSDDDLGFQRLPEFNITGSRSVNPFGSNPYGMKLIPRVSATTTQFERKEGYDGLRNDILPSVSLPFHYQNYFASDFSVGVRQTQYNLSDTSVPGSDLQLDDSSDRSLFYFSHVTSTAVEKVYDLEEDSWLSDLTSLGSANQTYRLKRLKHVVEPFVRYTFIPPTAQGTTPQLEADDLPFFDSVDRVSQKSVFTYGFRTTLFGRFLPPPGSGQRITELTPRIEEMPTVGSLDALPDLGSIDDFKGLGGVSSRVGEIRELAVLTLKQAYDYIEDEKDLEPTVDPFSDITGQLTFFPSTSFAFAFDENYDAEDADFSSWGISTHFRDDRGDALKARYSYREDSTSQIEGNIEIAMTEQLKLGYYARFDDVESEFIENQVAVRLLSACNCWHLDLGFSDKINPDKEQAFMRFTFVGLGDITQDFGLDEQRNAGP